MRRPHLSAPPKIGRSAATDHHHNRRWFSARCNNLRRVRIDEPRAIASPASHARSIATLARLAAAAVDCAYADVFLHEPLDDVGSLAFAAEANPDPVPFAWRCFLSDEPIIVTDPERNETTRDLPEVAIFPYKRFLCGMPILANGSAIGALVAFDLRARPHPSRLGIAAARLAARSIALCVRARASRDAAFPSAFSGPIRV